MAWLPNVSAPSEISFGERNAWEFMVILSAPLTKQSRMSSTVRSLADESFDVLVIEDCCAAATQELHEHELRVINMIYCHVMSADEVKSL